MVYVISNRDTVLMPTQRHGKVRRQLRDGKAVVVRREPFTIRLLYDTTEYTQPITLGVDAGTGHVGLSATTDRRELFSSEATLRKDIQNLLATKRESRLIDGTKVNAGVTYKKLQFVGVSGTFIINQLKRNLAIPPTNEFVGFLANLS